MDFSQALQKLGEAISGGKAMLIAAALVWLLFAAFKSDALGGLTAKIPKRWRAPAVLALGLLAALLDKLALGASAGEAIKVAFSGAVAIAAHEGLIEPATGARDKQ